jgi:hypothetical protein
LVHYQQHLPQHMSQPQPMATPASQAPQVPEQYQQPPHQGGQWYDNVAYQPPVEVISHIPSYTQANVFQDPWVQKLEAFDDPSLQMPSARIENL